jgi:hypothetical protein
MGLLGVAIMAPIHFLSNSGVAGLRPASGQRRIQPKLPVRLSGDFVQKPVSGPVRVRGVFSNDALTLQVRNPQGGATLRFTGNAVRNALAANPGGALQRAAAGGALIRSAPPAVAGRILGELGVNVLGDGIEIQQSRVRGAAPGAQPPPAAPPQPGGVPPPVAPHAALSALAQNAAAPNAINLFGDQTLNAAPGSAPRAPDLSILAQAQSAPLVFHVFDESPAAAPADSRQRALDTLAQANQNAPQILTLFNGGPGATGPAQNAGPPPAAQAPQPETAPQPAQAGTPEPGLTGAELNVLFSIFGIALAQSSATQSRPGYENVDNAAADNSTAYQGNVGVNLSADAGATVFENDNVKVDVQENITAEAGASGTLNVRDDGFSAQGSAGASMTASGSVAANVQISDNVNTETTVTGSASMYAKAEGSSNVTVNKDEFTAGGQGAIGAGAEVTLDATNTTTAGNSSVTTGGGVSAGWAVGAGGGGELSITDESFTIGVSGDVNVFFGGSVDLSVTIDYGDVGNAGNTVVDFFTSPFQAAQKDNEDDKPWWQKF